jgi:hypothetical protein
LDAAGITSALQQRAVVQLVRDLKKAQLWTKMKAIYPFVGGTATTHKWNLKDPQDSDAAARITFSGGWTHNSNGITGNGSNSIANCNRTPANLVTAVSSHISIYCRTNNTGVYFDINSYVVGTVFAHYIFLRNSNNIGEVLTYQAPNNSISWTSTDSSGFFLNSRISNTGHKGFRNNTEFGSSTTASSGFGSLSANYCIGANSFGTTAFSNRNYAFASIGDGLTDAEASLLYHCVDRYQKTLGRAV